MKKQFLILIAVMGGFLSMESQEYLVMIDEGTHSVQDVIDSAEGYFENRDKGRGTGYKQFKRWEYNAKRLMNEQGYLVSAEENLAELERFNAYLNNNQNRNSSNNDNWTDLGPFDWNATTGWNPGVGRITSIAIDKNDNNHIIIGGETGGVWKTTDGGSTWVPLSDHFVNLYVYSLAIDPSNSMVYYFGSYNGLIYKSTDAGSTWNQLGDMGSSYVNKLLIHPTNSNIMFATAQTGGIKKSTDGGVTWQSAVSDSQGYDVEFKPGDPSVVFASGTGFHKSTNGGTSFSTIGGFSSGPKMIGVSANDDTRVYVAEASNGIFGAFYSSTNTGSSFTKLNHGSTNFFGYSTSGNDNNGQAPRDMDICVNPSDANEVHIAGINTWRSTDAGVSFFPTSDWTPYNANQQSIGYCHADVDIMLFEGSTLFVGTDGGIFKAVNTASVNSNYYTDLTAGLGIRQFYKIGVSQSNDVVVSGGSQDNGTSFYTAANGWRDWLGADGMESFIDKTNNSIMYGTSQGGQIYRTDNAGSNYVGLNEPGSGSGNWVTPFEQDPTVVNTIYLGYSNVYRSTNKGTSWSAISQSFGNNLDQLKVAKSNNQVMYASYGFNMFKTADGGLNNWTTVTNPGGNINSIAIHPTDPNRVAVATASANRVMVTTDGGVTWLSYKKNLPNFSALALVWDNNGQDGLYLGMNYGIFYIDNTMTDWISFSNNLPNVIINELEINKFDSKIYAGTYGRGLWSSPKFDPNISVESLLLASEVTLFPNPAKNSISIKAKELSNVSIRIFDSMGKLLVYQRDISFENEHQIDISTFQNGIYFVKLNSDKGYITKKLIIE